jgi:transposase
MRFYTKQHKFYCGIDLHARTMSVCVVNRDGEVLLHRHMKAAPEPFFKAMAPYRDDLVVCVECLFTWEWLADLCVQEGISFMLGHALAMKAIPGDKATNDTSDSQKMAALRRGGRLPQASVYPAQMRATRDLLRRRTHLMRKRAELLAHVQHPTSRYNLPAIGKKIADKAHRDGMAQRFAEPAVHESLAVDLALSTSDDQLLGDLARSIIQAATHHDANTLSLLHTVPGSGKMLSLVRLYASHDMARFPKVQDFVSYGRLVTCAKESAGKRLGTAGPNIGNAHLQWAFAEAAVLCLRNNPAGQKYMARLEKTHHKGKALTILAHKLARAVYYMLKRNTAFALDKCLHG